jgi:hypothetical protein
MADKYALDLDSGPAFTGPGLPSAQAQKSRREMLLDPARNSMFFGARGSAKDNPTIGRPSFVSGGPPAEIPPPELSGDTRFTDYTRGIGKGLLDIAEGLAGTIELTGIVPVGTLTDKISTEAAEVISNMTLSAQENMRRKWASLDEESVIQNPKAAFQQLMAVLPSIAASYVGAAAGAAGMVGRLGKGATAAQKASAAGVGGALGGAGTEALQVGGQTMTEIAGMMEQVPHDELMQQSELYAQNYQRTGTEEQARNDTILDASRSTAMSNALFSALTAMVPGYVMGKQSQRLGAPGRGRRALTTGAVESGQEGIQESGTALGTGLAYQEHIDAAHDPYADLTERFTAGAALGFGAGTVAGAVSPGPPGQSDEDVVPPEIRAALPPPQLRLPAPETPDVPGGLPPPPLGLPAPQKRLEDLPVPPPDPNQAIPMGGFTPATQGEQQGMDLAPTGPPGPGAGVGPPIPGPQLDTTARTNPEAAAEELLGLLSGRRRYAYIRPQDSQDAATQEALGAVLERAKAENVSEGLVFHSDEQGGTLISFNEALVQEFAQTGQLPAPTPDVNQVTSGAQQGFEFIEQAPPARAKPRYPGGMTREEFYQADETLKTRREDRTHMDNLVQVITDMDAERVARQEQGDLIQDEARPPEPSQRKVAWGAQRRAMNRVVTDAERLSAEGTLDEAGVEQALATLDEMATTTAATTPTMQNLSDDFETVRELVDQYKRGEEGATETLNYINEMMGGKRTGALRAAGKLKQVQEILQGPDEKSVTRSKALQAARQRVRNAGEDVVTGVKEPGGKKRGVLKQRDLLESDRRRARLAATTERQKAIHEKRKASKQKQLDAASTVLEKAQARQAKAKETSRRRGQLTAITDAQLERADSDEQTLEALVAAQAADLAAAEEIQSAENEQQNLGVTAVAGLAGEATGEIAFEGEYDGTGILSSLDRAAEAETAPPAPAKKPPKKRKGKKRKEVSDEDKAWRDAARDAADATGHGKSGASNVVSSAGRQDSIENHVVPETAIPVTFNSDTFAEQYPNATVVPSDAQLTGANMILHRMNGGHAGVLVGDGTGAGKTLQAAIAADQARRQGKSVLLVTKGGQNATVFPKAMAQLGSNMHGLEIASYSTLASKVGSYDVVVYDEAHNLKNVGGKFFARFEAIDAGFNVFMSATPADMDSSLTLFALAQGKTLAQLTTELGIEVDIDGVVTEASLTDEYFKKLGAMISSLQNQAAYYRRALPSITTHKEVMAPQDTTQYEDTLTGESATLQEWDDRLAAAPSQKTATYWANSAKLAEAATFENVVDEITKALANGRKVIVMSNRKGGENKPITFTSADGTKHSLNVPSVLDMVAEWLVEHGLLGDVEHYYGKDKSGVKRFQNGPKRVLLTTYGKAGESIDLDDQVGDAPRTLISTMADWSAAAEEQARGRIDRASTMSEPEFIAIRTTGFTADKVRSSRLQSKREMLKFLQGSEREPLSYAKNTFVEDRGDRMFLSFVGMYYHAEKIAALKQLVKTISGGYPNWKYVGNREAHSVSKEVWPEVENAVRSVFDAARAPEVSNLDTAPQAEEDTAAVEALTAPDPVAQVQAENDMFFDRDAEQLARGYGISEDDLVDEGTGPRGSVTVADVETYWTDTLLMSQSFDLFSEQRDILATGEAVLAKDVLLDIQKNTKRSAPEYDLLRILIQKIGSTTVERGGAEPQGSAGQYQASTDRIQISFRSNTQKTVMHEALHAVLSHTIETNPDFRRRVAQLRREFFTELDSVKRATLTENERTLLDEIIGLEIDESGHEFMSYMLTEPGFQKILSDMPSKGNPNRSLWQKFKALIARVLRLNRRARSALDDLVDLAEEGATTKRTATIEGAPEQMMFSMSDSATEPLRAAVRSAGENYKGPRNTQQARSATRRTAMGVLTLRQLNTIYEDVLNRLSMGNPVARWTEALHRKEVTVKQYAAQGNKRYRDHRLVEANNPEHVLAFRTVMDTATKRQIYPNLGLNNPLNKGVDTAQYLKLRKGYNALPLQMRDEFVTLYEWYRDERNDQLHQQLVNTMLVTEATLLTGDKEVAITEKNAAEIATAIMKNEIKPSDLTILVGGEIEYKFSQLLQEAVQQKQEHSLARGPYFPLKRFGEFVAYGEKDHRTETATISQSEMDELAEKAAAFTEKRTDGERAEFTHVQKLVYNKKLRQLKRGLLNKKINEQLAPYVDEDPGRERGTTKFNDNATSASREHYAVYYAQHESASDAEADVAQLRDAGYTTNYFVDEDGNDVGKIGRRPDQIPRIAGAYGPLLTQMRAKLASSKDGERGEYERLMKALESSLLATMPETSVRSEMLKRHNREGNNTDAGRALAAHVRGAGYYRGQLLHGRQIGAAMAEINHAHSAVQRDNKYSQTDQDKVTAVIDEIRKHDAMDSAGNELGEISRGLANVGFLWVLLSPVYILVNMTQPGMFTMPWLAARSKKGGALRAARFLRAAYSVVTPDIINRTKKARGGIFTGNLNVDQELFDFLDPDGKSIGRGLAKRILESDLKYKHELVGGYGETGVLAELAAKNLLDMTLAADTRSAAAGRTNESLWERTLDSARIMPHLTEVLNRGVTAIAAYEMGRSEGMSKEVALKFAEDAIAETQFDYTLLNKPRFMSERAYSLAKPLFMFMQHPQHVYALFVKSAMFGTRGAKKYYALKRSGKFDKSNPEHVAAEQEFKVNRDTVVGILGTHLLMGGVLGAMFEPAKWALGLALLIGEMLTGEPPEDTKVYMHRFVTGLAGEEGGEAIMHGLPWALAGLNFSNNLSLSSLATFDNRFPEGREGVKDRVFAALGPLPALFANGAEGIKDIKDGAVAQGIARMMPRTLRELIRAADASQVGIQDSRGNTLIKASELSPYELAISALGISTAAKSQMYEDRAATQNLKYGHRAIRNRLKERLKRANTLGKRRAAVAAIAQYNRGVPFYAQINIFGSQAATKKTQRMIDKGKGAPLGAKERHLRQEI